MPYTVRDVDVTDSEYCARVAAMFNDFDSAWPGGFTRGVEETPERLQETMSRMKRLAILTVECDGEFVGYCDLEAQAGQMDAAYIPLLGARLSHHGKGVGKMLLREMVRRVAALGYKQVTLYTWPGNTKAVPLYKKTGFNWVPETDVFMRNYLPNVLTMPIGKAFFANRDWYEVQQREIVVAPDDVKWHGMKVYPYRFRDGNDFLHVTFDANAHGLTALETPDYAIACYIPVEEAPAGETCPITWELASRSGKPLDVVLLTETDAGLELSVQERLTVRDTATLTRDLRVSAEATPRPQGERSHRVRSTLLINGEPLVLETGVKVVRPVRMTWEQRGLIAGRPEKIAVALHSNLDRPLIGTLSLEAHPALCCDTPTLAFRLEPRLSTECEFTLTATEAGSFATELRFTADETTGSRPFSIRALSGSGAQASVDSVYDEEAFLESSGLRLVTGLRGGHLGFRNMTAQRDILGHDLAELGPPYVEESFTTPLYAARAEPTPNGMALVLTAPSKEFPGLTVERRLTLISDDAAQVEYRVTNTTDGPLPARLRLKTHPWLGGALAAPTPRGLIREPLRGWGEYPEGEIDMMAHGARLAENWIACEEDGLCCGIVWHGEPKQDIQWSRFPHLTYDLGELPPHSVRAIPPVTLVGGFGDWQTVRGWWRRLVQPSGTREEHPPEPVRVLEVKAEPAALLTTRQADITVAVQNRRGLKLNGKLTLMGETFAVAPKETALEGVERDHPFTATFHVTAPETPSAGFVKAALDTGQATETFPIPVLRIGSEGRTSVREGENGLYIIENGVLTLRVAPDFLGSMIALERGGVNHLLSAYPKPRPFVWSNPWYGGVSVLPWEYMTADKLPSETFTGAPVERVGAQGLRWQGVRVACLPKHKDLRWLGIELDYLTLPGSNMVALASRWTNRASARREFNANVGVFAQVGGTRENSIAHWERDGVRRHRRRGGFSMEGNSGKWAAVENPETGDTLILVTTEPRSHVDMGDEGKEGPHLQAISPTVFGPNETKERLYWLILADSPAAMDPYASLAQVRSLP